MEKGRGKKRRAMDEKILAKAKKHIVEPNADDDDDGGYDDDMPHVTEVEIDNILNPVNTEEPAPPVKKIRKPRHTETEKKSKALAEEEPSPEKKKRKKKKKKSKSKVTTTPVKTPDSIERHGSDALDFLQKWKDSLAEWKFEKRKQVWLLQNCLNPDLVPEEFFPTLLEYMSSVRGQARAATEKDMGVAMKAYEVVMNPSDGLISRYERARQILQVLADD